MESVKYYLYNSREDAQKLINKLTATYGSKMPYTEIRASDEGTKYAIRADEFTETITNKKTEALPADFYS